jgi:hypothetical protein
MPFLSARVFAKPCPVPAHLFSHGAVLGTFQFQMLTPKKKPKNHVHALGRKGRASERSGSQKCIAHARRPHVRWVWLTLAPDPPHRIPVGGLGPGGQRHRTSWISPGPLLYYYWSTYLLRFLFSQVCAIIHVTSRSPAISSHTESESRKSVISWISKGGRFCYYYLHTVPSSHAQFRLRPTTRFVRPGRFTAWARRHVHELTLLKNQTPFQFCIENYASILESLYNLIMKFALDCVDYPDSQNLL